MVGRRSHRAEVSLREDMDLWEMRILVVVGSKQSENLCHWKGKGSLTMQFSQGLVDPNLVCKSNRGKGRQVNIPVPLQYVWWHKSNSRRFGLGQVSLSAHLTVINQGSIVMMRTWLNAGIVLLMEYLADIWSPWKENWDKTVKFVPRTSTGAPRWETSSVMV
jgi:hypothetical protein